MPAHVRALPVPLDTRHVAGGPAVTTQLVPSILYTPSMSTLVCVPILVHDEQQAQADAMAARNLGADLVEFRVDTFYERLVDESEEPWKPVLRVVRESELPCIVTCRPEWEGGSYIGPEEPRADLFERLLVEPERPRYIDVELDAFRRSPGLLGRLRAAKAGSSTGIMVSIHDFDGRPHNLSRLLLELRDLEIADVTKIAIRARSLRDNLELFEILRQADTPTIALGMGVFGTPSRVLAPRYNALLTFASLRDESATAPGQLTISELLTRHRFRSISRTTGLYGVIGWPVAHSMSPAVHSAGFEAVEHDAVYLPLPVAGDEDPESSYASFKASLTALIDDDHLDFRGASVTLPHKSNLVRLGIEMGWDVEPFARACNAANTLTRLEEQWHVTNTDAPAAVDLLEREIGPVRDKRVLVLGAGGVARAIVFELLRRGACIGLCNRSQDRANKLIEDASVGVRALQTQVPGSIERTTPTRFARAHALINCTPVGMVGGPDETGLPIPLEQLQRIEGLSLVQDTVYNPPETSLLKAAASLGLATLDGVEMFVAQACEQFRIWTGHKAPASLYETIVRESLASKD